MLTRRGFAACALCAVTGFLATGASTPIGFHQRRRLVVEQQKSAELPALSMALGYLAVDELPGVNRRRERAGATLGGGAYGAYRCATSGGG
jgi:hypothetical protein